MTPAKIKLNNLTLTYDLYYDKSSSLKELVINLFHRRKYVEKRKEKLNAVNEVTFEVNQGERIGIIGKNGSGKSTLLKVISGILKPTRGELEIVGTVQPLIEVSAGFNPEYSGRENIYLNGYMLGFSKEEIENQESEIIEFSDIKDFIDVPVKYYSTGMSMKLAFTIATSIKPEILVFDEMLSAGDAAFLEKAKKRLDCLVDKAKIVLLVTHDLNLVQEFATRVLVIANGSIVFDGPATDAVAYYRNEIVNAKTL